MMESSSVDEKESASPIAHDDFSFPGVVKVVIECVCGLAWETVEAGGSEIASDAGLPY